MKMFLSDNVSGVHKNVLDELSKVNVEHVNPYSDDMYSKEVKEKFCKLFNKDVDVYFTTTGTSANVIGISGMINSYEAVICSENTHINVDECGAFEKFLGAKILYFETNDGKFDINKAKRFLEYKGSKHKIQPKAVAFSQPTETGTVYSIEEIKAICDFAHSNNLLVHMDGARISNAIAHLGVSLEQMVTKTGIDVLSFGGTKNGMMMGEAIIILNDEVKKDFLFKMKQAMQLVSKGRFIAAQFRAYLTNDLWVQNAKKANEMALLLYENLIEFDDIRDVSKPDANILFAKIPKAWNDKLIRDYPYYIVNEETNEVRFVTSFDTSENDINDFVSKIGKIIDLNHSFKKNLIYN
ncbi:aminotransferase class V-fold PLP-dependent enzyme [Peptostreptococcaceae bacterium AGR-M142]